MIFETSQPFDEALESRRVRTLLPTELRTRELDDIAPGLRERAMFSAGVTSAEFLQEADDAIAQLLTSDISLGEARIELQTFLDRAGYGAEDRLSGDLTKLGSIRRQNIILETNTQMAQGYGQHVQANSETARDLWPAQELIRTQNADEPRNWEARWTAAGGTLIGGRMIARKDDRIWTDISRFGLPYPPFDFNSGMGLRPVARDEAVRLGVIAQDETPEPDERGLNDDLQASPNVRSQRLRTALTTALQGIAAFTDDGVLRRITE